MAVRRRVLSIAAASGRVGYVVLEDMTVSTWGLSRKASSGAPEAAACAAGWIERIRPDVVVTEKVLPRSKKGRLTREVTDTIAAVADVADVLHIAVVRWQGHANKFEEAAALATDHSRLAHLVPKARKPWDSEPKTTVYFEALALALSALGDPKIDRRRTA